MAAIRRGQAAAKRPSFRVPVALPAFRWMIHVGAAILRTDPELILKSRRVRSAVLHELGFEFEFPAWPGAAAALTEDA